LFNDIRFVRVELGDPSFWDTVSKADLFVFRYGHYDTDHQKAQTLIPLLERQLQIKCFPNVTTCWHYDDKIRQYYLMRNAGFPMTDSYIFWERAQALAWLAAAPLPVVFKLKGGAGSNNVLLVRSRGQGERLIKTMFGRGMITNGVSDSAAVRFAHFNLYRELHHLAGNAYRAMRGEDVSEFWQRQKNYVLFQKFLPGNPHDTRVTIIGDRAFAFRRLVRTNDFRASGSGLIEYEPQQIDLRCVQIAFQVSKTMEFQSMAYDFLFNADGDPEFCEISYIFWDSAIFRCPGHWDENLNWHTGHTWPQFAILQDLLAPGIRQPSSNQMETAQAGGHT
jgi:glutathione synthase/RimK-type ligase-like ATP-grasp enzyme